MSMASEQRCGLRVTKEALAKALYLPAESVITAVFQDAEDHKSDTFSLALRGVGPETVEGEHFRYVTHDSLTESLRSDTNEKNSVANGDGGE